MRKEAVAGLRLQQPLFCSKPAPCGERFLDILAFFAKIETFSKEITYKSEN
jgi:hypothetical protein